MRDDMFILEEEQKKKLASILRKSGISEDFIYAMQKMKILSISELERVDEKALEKWNEVIDEYWKNVAN